MAADHHISSVSPCLLFCLRHPALTAIAGWDTYSDRVILSLRSGSICRDRPNKLYLLLLCHVLTPGSPHCNLLFDVDHRNLGEHSAR